MSNGNGVKSVSLADGTLSPDLRVNYNFGLVLGVNEFQQEQAYFLQKDYLYNRAFEGYGTVSGLRVTAEWLKGGEVQINIGSGMAIDQFGRPIVIREALCARLTAWLKKQVEQNKDIIKEHRSEDRKKRKEEHERREEREGRREGREKREEREEREEEKRDLRVYIVARFVEYADGQVPIAGQACNSGDTDPIYSRIHDSYQIAFSWEPPTMPAWDSVRCFAQMMERVRIETNGERDDTEEIIEHMHKLDKPGSIALCAPAKKRDNDDGDVDEHRDSDAWDNDDDDERKPRWFIPADKARAALDRIFTTWVTEVRPKLLPDLLDPSLAGTKAQPDILLAHIDFTLDHEASAQEPKIRKYGFDQPDNSGRPYLLPTQLMQELLLLGHQKAQEGGGDGEGLPASEFATIQVRNSHTLYAWIHHLRKLEIEVDDGKWGEVFEVRSNGQPLEITHVVELEENFFEIHVKVGGQEDEGVPMPPGARVELVFKVDEIRVERTDDDKDDEEDEDEDDDGRDEHKKSGDLGEDIEEGAEEVGEVAEEVAGGVKDTAEEIVGSVEQGVGTVVQDAGEILEKVEHAFGSHEKTGEKVEQFGKKIGREGDEQVAKALANEKRLDREEGEDAKEDAREDTKKGEKAERERSLAWSIRRHALNYVGYDYEHNIIIVYTIASHIPVRELATFFVYDEQSDLPNMPHTELKKVTTAEHFLYLWFHTDEPVRLPSQVRVLRTFVNQQAQELLFNAFPPPNQRFSWFWVLEPQSGEGEVKLAAGELLTVLLNTNEIGVGNQKSLAEVMKETPFTCLGYDGNHTIRLHRQVSFSEEEHEGEERTITGKLEADQEPTRTNDAPGPALPFVHIIITGRNQGADGAIEVNLELWFHLSVSAEQDRVGFTENLSFDVLLEEGRRMETISIPAAAPTRVQHNVYNSVVTLPRPRPDQHAYYLRLRFGLDRNEVNVRGTRSFYQTLGDYIRDTGIRFEGYNGDNAIVAYVRVAIPPPNAR